MGKAELEIRLDEITTRIQNAKSPDELSKLWDEEDTVRQQLADIKRVKS